MVFSFENGNYFTCNFMWFNKENGMKHTYKSKYSAD
jgi:hypothetical protein